MCRGVTVGQRQANLWCTSFADAAATSASIIAQSSPEDGACARTRPPVSVTLV